MSDHSELKKAAEACRFTSGVALIGARVQFHALANPSVVLGLIAEIKARTMFPNTTMGVGSGDGRLFVHGDYDSIKAAQAIVIERDQLKAENEALRKDAERYRWLMSDAVNNGTLGIDGGWIDFGFKDEAAEIIDKAMQQETKP